MRSYPAFFHMAGSVLLVAFLSFALVACGQKHYGDGDVREISGVTTGTILDVSDVMVEEDPSLIGPGIGLAAGGLLGSAFGGGTGRVLMVLGGAAIGADIGGYGDADYSKRRYRAVQLTIETDRGGVLVVVQGDNEYFVRGDRVRVIGMGKDRATVQHQ